ncbi:hypothetical protein QYM36_004560 [Artemia franciscana]|uniref:Haloacid dehalogenase-like hydrolase domain-containing protein 2 n=1 Tax=Artemia franciscana TaxID=6661 RepID=A0AA88I303_ARTSF|nr:hypothetical protein QYM36_004560 [Artemia franciscana]
MLELKKGHRQKPTNSLFGLRVAGLKVRFVTNTTKESKGFLLNRLNKLGFAIEGSEIFSSLTAARQLIEKKKSNPILLLENEALEDFKGIPTKEGQPNCVVIGLAPSMFTYEVLNTAFRAVLDGATIIAIHKGRYYKRADGLALGPGPFVAALEYATNRTAVTVGKPEKSFFLSAFEDLKVNPEEVVMIGDDVRDDVEGAVKAGLFAILVKTGKYRTGDEEIAISLSAVAVKDFAAAVDHVLSNRR